MYIAGVVTVGLLASEILDCWKRDVDALLLIVQHPDSILH